MNLWQKIKMLFKTKSTYYFNDKNELHRTDGPAIEWYADGGKGWYVNGELHRLDGPAVEHANGDKFWCVNGKVHRTDGPAIEYASGDKAWCVNGKVHRTDGPAIEYASGDKFWWVDGKNLTEEQFNKHPLVVEARMVRLISEVLDEG